MLTFSLDSTIIPVLFSFSTSCNPSFLLLLHRVSLMHSNSRHYIGYCNIRPCLCADTKNLAILINVSWRLQWLVKCNFHLNFWTLYLFNRSTSNVLMRIRMSKGKSHTSWISEKTKRLPWLLFRFFYFLFSSCYYLVLYSEIPASTYEDHNVVLHH